MPHLCEILHIFYPFPVTVHAAHVFIFATGKNSFSEKDW